MPNYIKVLILDDSVYFRDYLSHSLSQESSIQIVGTASTPEEMRQFIAGYSPDVVTLDMEMSKASSHDLLAILHTEYPQVQVIAVSANPLNVLEALHRGAVDFVTKPNSQSQIGTAAFVREMVNKIRIAAVSARAHRQRAQIHTKPTPVQTGMTGLRQNSNRIIAMGASTGGTEAILTILRTMPVNCPGIVIVQHMPPMFTTMFAERLDRPCTIAVKEATDGDRVSTGQALLAPGGMHMRICRDNQGYFVRCETGEPVSGHCPSVDILFESVAQQAGANSIGVILTGMGSDGAKGLLRIRQAGGHTIGQDKESCVVYGMPMVAYNIGGVEKQLPLSSIADCILQQLFK